MHTNLLVYMWMELLKSNTIFLCTMHLFHVEQLMTESSTADEMNMVYLSVLRTAGALLAVQGALTVSHILFPHNSQ